MAEKLVSQPVNDSIQKCAACGSSRVVAGRLVAEELGNSSELNSPSFNFSELMAENKTFYISSPRRGVLIRQHGIANVCLDCGVVSAALKVDAKEATELLEKWGADAVKARLATGSKAV